MCYKQDVQCFKNQNKESTYGQESNVNSEYIFKTQIVLFQTTWNVLV